MAKTASIASPKSTVEFLRTLPLQLSVFFLLLIGAIWAGIFFELKYAHERAIANTRRDTGNLARAFAEQVRTSARGIDLSLLALREEWRRNPSGFHDAVLHQQNYFLRDVSFQVAVIDADGALAYSNLEQPAKPVSLADREHFRVYRERRTDALFISKPVLGRVSKRWSIQFTRPILGPDERFLGVVVMSVPPEYFSRFYDTISLGEHGTVMLLRSSGDILARSPDPAQGMGKSLADRPYLGTDAPETGSIALRAHIDGIERLASWHRLGEFGLVVVVCEAFDSILAPYRAQRRAFLIGGGALTALLLAFGYSLIAGLRQRASAVAARASSEERDRLLVAALEAVGNGVVITDADARIEWANPAFETLTGYTPAEALGRRPAELVRSGVQRPPFYAAMWDTILGGKTWRGELVNKHKDGSLYDEELVITPVRDAVGAISHFVGIKQDVTERKRTEAQIRNLAFYDPLTELPNRRLLFDRLGHALAASARSRRYGALMLLDLDHFKILNDTQGHDVGDQLLIQAAQRLTACVRESDTVARLGGDEFVVMLEDLDHEGQGAAAQAESVAGKIRESLGRPYALKGTCAGHCNTASIGIALFVGTGYGTDDLLKHADIALYQAKDAGRNQVSFYEGAMQAAPDSCAAGEK